jgi:phosphohistidine phosphatase
MELYLLRHGEAEPHSTDDASRALTPKGRRDVRVVVELAMKAGTTVDVVFTSPLVRAKETAQIAAEVMEVKRIVETRALLPDAVPASMWKELQKLPESHRVLLSGHEPSMSNLISFLLDAHLEVDFKKGAMARISIAERKGILKWLLTPRLARA